MPSPRYGYALNAEGDEARYLGQGRIGTAHNPTAYE